MVDNLEEYDDPYVYEAEYGQYRGDFNLLLNLIDKGSVLDLGCGTGRLAIPLAQKGLEVVGLDASEPMLEFACHKSALSEGKSVYYSSLHPQIRMIIIRLK